MSVSNHVKRIIYVGFAALALPLLTHAQQPDQAEAQPQGQGQGQGQGRIQMFSRLDTNSDGALNFEEFSAMPRPENRPDGAVTPEVLEQRFTRMDSDGNGLLSPEELQQGQRRGNGGGMRPQGQGDGQGQGRPERQGQQGQGQGQGQGNMRQRMENMTPEQREQMRERMQQMTPEQRQQMMQRRQGDAAAPAASGAPAHDHGE